MAESITCQRGLITAGGDKEPGGGGQAVRSGERGTGSALFLRPRAAPFSRLMPMEDGSRRLVGCPRPSPSGCGGGEPRAAAAAGMEDAQPRARHLCRRRCGGRVPAAAPRTRATRGDSGQGWGAHPTPLLRHICGCPLPPRLPTCREAQRSA